jgi:hypothetical protein
MFCFLRHIDLHELIRKIRQCKSAAEERKEISQECANIRGAFKHKSNLVVAFVPLVFTFTFLRISTIPLRKCWKTHVFGYVGISNLFWSSGSSKIIGHAWFSW